MTSAQRKRRRRVELLIDQRLVGFLKPLMTVSSNPARLQEMKRVSHNVTEFKRVSDSREERAS